MSKRFAWLLGVVVLVGIGLLVACGTTYKASSDGLVLVGSQGSAVIQTFSFALSNGHVSGVSNPAATSGQPSSIVLDPAGAYAYAIIDHNSIAAFKVNSSGTTTAVGTPTPDPNPVALYMDSQGKFLFVAEGLISTAIANSAQTSTACIQSQTQFGVCVYAIGAGGSLTAVQGTFTSALPMGFQTPNFVDLAATPTVFPGLVNGVQQAVCSSPGNNPPASEYLYAADSVNNVVWEFSVNTSTGALSNPPNTSQVQYFPSASMPLPTLSVPSGVAVDACNRFVYVANALTNNISAYSMCNGSTTQSSTCPMSPDGSLVPVSGSPFNLSGGANGPGPMVVDPFGNYLYVVDTLSNQVSTLHISPVSGSLTSGTPTVVATGSQPKAIAIRSDDSWLFVSGFQSATLSQYAITPASGALAPQPAITTDNYPWGVAVK